MLLLDPLVAVSPDHSAAKLTSSPQFWDRILAWAGDARVHVGEESHALIYEEYAKYGYPEHHIDLQNSPARREYQAALNTLLSRIWRHTRESGEVRFSSDYIGSSEHHLALQLDVSGTASVEICGVATDESHWSGLNGAHITVTPTPPSSLEICLQPGFPLQREASRRIKDFFSGKRLHIVGGQVDQKVIANLCSRLAIDSGDVSWLACEKAKPPRDLDKRWKMIDSERDITICVTGRVGHATSNVAAQAALRAGAAHIQVELPSGIEHALVNHATLHNQ